MCPDPHTYTHHTYQLSLSCVCICPWNVSRISVMGVVSAALLTAIPSSVSTVLFMGISLPENGDPVCAQIFWFFYLICLAKVMCFSLGSPTSSSWGKNLSASYLFERWSHETTVGGGEMRLREKGANKSAVWATGAQPRQGVPGAGVACISVVARGASQSSTFSSQSWVEGSSFSLGDR